MATLNASQFVPHGVNKNKYVGASFAPLLLKKNQRTDIRTIMTSHVFLCTWFISKGLFKRNVYFSKSYRTSLDSDVHK